MINDGVFLAFACPEHKSSLIGARRMLGRDRAELERRRHSWTWARVGHPSLPIEPLASGAAARRLVEKARVCAVEHAGGGRPGPGRPPRPHPLGYLLGSLHRRAIELETEALAQLGTGVKQHAALTVLADEESMTQQELGLRLGIDRTTIVTVVDDLQNAGLIERTRNPGDRRSYLVALTPSGKATQQHVTEPDDGDVVVLGEGAHRLAEALTELAEQRRGGERIAEVIGQERHDLGACLQFRHVAVEIDPVRALDVQGVCPSRTSDTVTMCRDMTTTSGTAHRAATPKAPLRPPWKREASSAEGEHGVLSLGTRSVTSLDQASDLVSRADRCWQWRGSQYFRIGFGTAQ
jgi:DNA-binding MarR family transcriptional regulator